MMGPSESTFSLLSLFPCEVPSNSYRNNFYGMMGKDVTGIVKSQVWSYRPFMIVCEKHHGRIKVSHRCLDYFFSYVHTAAHLGKYGSVSSDILTCQFRLQACQSTSKCCRSDVTFPKLFQLFGRVTQDTQYSPPIGHTPILRKTIGIIEIFAKGSTFA